MLRDSFCSSPWFHVRLSYDGSFELCRWGKNCKTTHNIRDCSIMDFYNSDEMRQLRKDLLDGNKPKACESCYYQDSFGKLSGRQRQLLKSAVTLDDFDLKMRASPHYDRFLHSYQTDGHTDNMPVDIQIDLGNICNSACIMCRPDQSSKLAVDYAKLNAIEPTMFAAPERYRSWTQDPVILDSVVEQLAAIPNIRYLHFLGGETLYDPAFHQICERLIASGLATDIIVGTTTNGTIYDERIERYIRSFKEFHLGISIETVTTLNDYVRWPSRIEDILANIKKFNSLRGETGLYNSLRITPNVLTISQFDSMARFMLDNDIAAESCNILHRPAMLRMELMPEDIRQETIAKLRGIVEEHDLNKSQLINFRSNSHIRQAISNVIIEYITFLENYRVPEDADKHRTDLVRFLKAFEKLRGNSILDHAPRYEQFLRHHGY